MVAVVDQGGCTGLTGCQGDIPSGYHFERVCACCIGWDHLGQE
jgi:hypothetical protein